MQPTPNRPLRFVIDTNIVVSALLWDGKPRALLRLAADPARLQLFTSPMLLGELQRVLAYPKLQPLAAMAMSAEAMLFHYCSIVTVVEPSEVTKVVHRDPDDDQVAAVALMAKADAIVSGDDDLLSLR
ncbi:MAG: putative toxin-antitoxin system toxin component, PIN family [Sphingomonadales bacterium]|nr:putative toxin-antitoxin system toxin component, PIN family [Sphingomonadales bacterium]MBK9004692.1 putative toxin-antitoxin system toxin component, PIN family [Sphingomonadales bacterium]MBK9269875.1 putative toxin-antitoxin system toxin component, PIN family [Sphingomonadales bacterium]MBP6433809.1 putative toxin-antitoxin system toxin component, PIN family [Sphingorhabdus sp.]